MTWQQLQGLAADGNEVGGHTAYHADLPQIDPTEAQRQICDDRVNLLNHGYQPTDFAYPYGDYSVAVESMVQNCGYNSARSTDSLGSAVAESIPPQNVYAVRAISGSNSLATMENAVSNAEQNGGGWLPVVFHDICSGCSSVSTTQADFTAFLTWLQQQSANGVTVQTVLQVIAGAVQPAVQGPAFPTAPSGSNPLRNSSLEQNTLAGAAPDCTQFDHAGNNSFNWTRTTNAHSGSYAEWVFVSSYTDGDNKLLVQQDLGHCTPTVTPGHQYRLSTWYESTVSPFFTVFARDNQYAFSYWTASPTFTAAASWTQATWVTPPIPSNVNGLSFGLTLDSVGSLTVDDIAIVDAAATPIVDTTPPVVSIASPAGGATVSGTVGIAANASDNVMVDRVDFLVDGAVVGSLLPPENGPTTFSWNTHSIANGNHTLKASAVDSSGNTTTSSGVTVFVANQTTNLLQNASLETAGLNNVPACWLLGGYGTNSYSWTHTTDARTGSYAENLNISSYTSGDRKIVNAQDSGSCAPAVTAGHTYTVSAWYKSSVQAFFFAYYRNSSGGWVFWTNSARFAGASSWTQASWTTPAVPSGATLISVGMGSASVGSLTMDDFSLFDNAPQPDTTPPTSAISCNNGAVEGTCASFYSGPVQVTLTATDNPGGSGVASIRYTTDGTDPSPTNGTVYAGPFSVTASGTTIKYRAYDNAGNAEPVKSQLIRIDTIPPVSTVSCNGSGCSGAFYNAAVSVTLAATDQGGSGVRAIYYTTDGSVPSTSNGNVYLGSFSVTSTETVNYRAYDNAGNAEAANSQSIKIDTTAPTSAISCNGTTCTSSDYSSAVSVTLAATDNAGGSGVAQIVYTTDGSVPSLTNGTTYSSVLVLAATTTVKYRAYDNAGNAEPVNSQLIQIDTTAPTSASSCNGATCAGSYYNSAVSVSLSASDNAGGSGVASIRYTSDGSDPSLTNGNLYGGAFSLAATTTVKYRAYDNAGNAEAVNSQLIRIDTTAPSSTISCNGGACAGSYYTVAVSVALTATDNAGGSGVAQIVYTTDGSVPSLTNGTTYGSVLILAGTTTVKYRAYDNAGNAEPVNSQLIQIDTTAPTSAIGCDGATCAGSYYNSAVSVSLSATDNPGGSGVASIRYTTDGSDPSLTNGNLYGGAFSLAATTTVKYRAYDNAGNAERVNSQLIQIETTAPTVTLTSPANGATVNGIITLGASASDNVAVDHVDFLVDGQSVGSVSAAPYNLSWDSRSVPGGTHTIQANAVNAAGNQASSAIVSVTVQNTADTTPPTSAISCNGVACASGFYNGAVSITLTATDNPGGSGVASIRYTTDGTDPSVTNGTTYSGAFSLAATTTVKYRAFDNAGNVEPVNSQLIQIDTTAPSSTISCNGGACASSYYTAAVAVTLSATDNGGGSGVASIRYTTDGTAPSLMNGTTYSGAFSLAATATVKYRAYDNAGNAEPVNAASISVDTTPPTSAISCSGVACASGFYNGAVSITLTATDNPGGSGVASIRYTTDGTDPSLTNGTTYSGAFSLAATTTVKYRGYDNAGNVEPVNSELIQIDTTAPSSTISCNGGACASSYYTAAVAVTLSATDNAGGSGVASIHYTTDGTAPSLTNGTTYSGAFSLAATTTVKYRAYDNAGNAEPVNAASISVDTTPPTTTITCNAAACSSGYYQPGVLISLSATDAGSGVASIRYTTDGTDPSLTNGSTYTGAFVLNVTLTVKYRAYDNVGNVEPVNSQLVQIDGTPPSVSLTSPAAGAVVAGSINLTAAASDNVAVARVDFLVDGKTVGSVSTPPYVFSWNSQSVGDGTHAVVARAVDEAGNSTLSSSISITVTNSNLLPNPSLEAAGSNNVPSCWLLGGYGTNTYSWTHTTDSHSGTYGENLTITSYSSGDRKLVTAQDSGTCAPAVTPGHTYTLSAWYKSNVEAYFFVYYRNSSGSWVFWATSPKFAASSSWTQASWTTPALPTGATLISVGMGSDAIGSLTMDDFGLFATG